MTRTRLEQLPNLDVANRPRIARVGPQIPEFLVERVMIDRESWLEVTCQRVGCKRMFMVRPRPWLDTSEQPTRPCPYCFKVGRVVKPKKGG